MKRNSKVYGFDDIPSVNDVVLPQVVVLESLSSVWSSVIGEYEER